MGEVKNQKTENSLETSRADLNPNSVHARLGNNLEFIATYLFTHWGATSSDVRKALCRFRGKEYHRGMYCSYFAHLPKYNRKSQYRDRYWVKKGKCWYLTTQGMGLVKLQGEDNVL